MYASVPYIIYKITCLFIYLFNYQVYLPPEACETLKGFLAVVGGFKKAEFKVGCLRLTESEEVAKPTTVEVAAAIVELFRIIWWWYVL